MSLGLSHSIRFFMWRGAGPAVLLTLCMTPSAGCMEQLLHQNKVVPPHIVPQINAPSPIDPVYNFPFEGSTITLPMPINRSVYAGAKAADKEVTVHGNVSEHTWVAQT